MATAATMLITVGVSMILALAGSPPAFAEPDVANPRVGEPRGLFTEVTITGIGVGQSVDGFDAPASFDPLDGYPDPIPDGSTAHFVSYAGTLTVADPDTGRSGLTYCIDLGTDTQIGVHYEIGDWTEANVPNLGHVEYILTNYYPTTGEPAGAATDAQRAAAVQAAVWFFSDSFIVATGSPVRALTEAIVADALANGPLAEPRVPELSVAPEVLPAPATGEIVGPLGVTADGPATITSTGVEVFSDPDGANLLEDGDEVLPGAQLWVRSVSAADPQGFVLERVATILQGTVFLYDGSNPGLDEAQKLVLAQQTELVERAGALIEPFAAGGLELTKQITGTGAGFQGEIVIEVDCEDPDGDLDQQHILTLAGSTAAGEYPQQVTGIPAGNTCTVTETADGDNDLVNLTGMVVDPEVVTIVEGETQEVSVTNSFARALGSMQVTKIIAGPAADAQAALTIDVACDDPDGAFDQQYILDAGLPAGRYPQPAITGIPAGTQCTVTHLVTGENNLVELATPATIETFTTVTIADAATSQVILSNTYVERGGELADTGAAVSPALLAVLGLTLLAVGAALVAHQTCRRRTST